MCVWEGGTEGRRDGRRGGRRDGRGKGESEGRRREREGERWGERDGRTDGRKGERERESESSVPLPCRRDDSEQVAAQAEPDRSAPRPKSATRTPVRVGDSDAAAGLGPNEVAGLEWVCWGAYRIEGPTGSGPGRSTRTGPGGDAHLDRICAPGGPGAAVGARDGAQGGIRVGGPLSGSMFRVGGPAGTLKLTELERSTSRALKRYWNMLSRTLIPTTCGRGGACHGSSSSRTRVMSASLPGRHVRVGARGAARRSDSAGTRLRAGRGGPAPRRFQVGIRWNVIPRGIVSGPVSREERGGPSLGELVAVDAAVAGPVHCAEGGQGVDDLVVRELEDLGRRARARRIQSRSRSAARGAAWARGACMSRGDSAAHMLELGDVGGVQEHFPHPPPFSLERFGGGSLREPCLGFFAAKAVIGGAHNVVT